MEKRLKTAVIGPGHYFHSTIKPVLKRLENRFEIVALAAKTRESLERGAFDFPGAFVTTHYKEILQKPNLDLVMILTRDLLHTPILIDVVKAGKSVFIEKPLAINNHQLEQLKSLALTADTRKIFTGFNRRCAPFTLKLKETLLTPGKPRSILVRLNSKQLDPTKHWLYTADANGRMIFMGCHFVDIINHLVEGEMVRMNITTIQENKWEYQPDDNFSLTMTYQDGSFGSVFMTSMGQSSGNIEEIQIFCDKKAARIIDFREMEVWTGRGDENKEKYSLGESDFGHYNAINSIYECCLLNKENPIDFQSSVVSSQQILELHQSSKEVFDR